MQANNRNCLSRGAGLALVESFYASGQKQKDFCSGQNISYHILQYWKQLHSKINGNLPAKFVPVKVANAGNGAVKIIINASMVIEVTNSSDLSLLKSVMEVCKQCG